MCNVKSQEPVVNIPDPAIMLELGKYTVILSDTFQQCLKYNLRSERGRSR